MLFQIEKAGRLTVQRECRFFDGRERSRKWWTLHIQLISLSKGKQRRVVLHLSPRTARVTGGENGYPLSHKIPVKLSRAREWAEELGRLLMPGSTFN
jgi:hypothetical protein